MKRFVIFFVSLVLLHASFAVSQNSGAPDPYPPLDRLESLTRQTEPEWRFHADIPHSEDLAVIDSEWGVLAVKNVSERDENNTNAEHWTATRVFRRWIQIPETINGYATQGSRASIDLRFRSPGNLRITVFSNGAILHRGSDDDILPVRSGPEALAPAETDTGGSKTSPCGNLLQTFVDKPKQWDAWNIDADFEKQHWDLDKADEVKLVENGPLRAVIQVKNHFQNSTFVRDVTLYAGVPRVDVKMQTDWHEKHILLKVAFPPGAQSATETNLMEKPIGSLALHDGAVSVPTKRYEIKTVRVQFSGMSPTAATQKP